MALPTKQCVPTVRWAMPRRKNHGYGQVQTVWGSVGWWSKVHLVWAKDSATTRCGFSVPKVFAESVAYVCVPVERAHGAVTCKICRSMLP